MFSSQQFIRRPGWPTPAAAAAILIGALAAVPAIGAAAVSESPSHGAGTFAERPQFADVIEDVKPAVVAIVVQQRVEAYQRLQSPNSPVPNQTPFDEFFRRFFDAPGGFGHGFSWGPVREGLGSGFIIDSSGYIVTNNHVIDGADEIKVTMSDGREFPAELVGRDPHTDLALLKVDAPSPLPSVEFGDSDRTRIGDWVVAIGNPFGFGNSATAGIISARGRDLNSGPYDDFLQIDAPINRGNSGGPIFDADGKVIGVNTAIYSPNGGNVGIGFAIPSREAEGVIAQLREHGTVRRGWLGVRIQPVTADVAEGLGKENASGALVADVVDGSPAARAGVQVGDVIVRFDGTAVDGPKNLSRAVADAAPGSRADIEIWRDGRRRDLAVDLAENEPEPIAAAGPNAPDAPGKVLGLGLAPLSRDMRDRLNLPEDAEGALVVNVAPDSPAAASGIRAGDVISQVDQRAVKEPQDVVAALSPGSGKQRPILVLVRRGDTQFFATVKTA